MTKAIRFDQTGGPDVLQRGDVNFLDLAQRRGAVKVPLPSGLGLEAAGRVVAVGPGSKEVSPGDRVVYALGPIGAYAKARLYPADRLIVLPDEIAFDDAASIFFKGLTAHYLLHDTYTVEAGSQMLLYGASGGVGQIMARWAASKGARVIGVVSNASSTEVAKSAGCDEVLVWGAEDLAARVKALTGGAGADVVYDGVGKDTFEASMDSLRRRGLSPRHCRSWRRGRRPYAGLVRGRGRGRLLDLSGRL